MKRLLSAISVGFLMMLIDGCSQSTERYIDVSTGKPVELVKDEKTGLMVSKETGVTLKIYVDSKNHDTVYGITGKVINGHIVKIGGDYVFDEDEKLQIGENGEMKYKDGDYKVKVEPDGDNKTKSGDTKIKSDGDGKKVKND